MTSTWSTLIIQTYHVGTRVEESSKCSLMVKQYCAL